MRRQNDFFSVFSCDSVQTGCALVIGFLRTYRSYLQVTIALSLFHSFHNSLHLTPSLLSLLYLHQLSPGNGFQRRSVLSFRIPVLTVSPIRHGSSRQRRFQNFYYCCLRVCCDHYIATAVIWPLPSNGFTCHSI
jgi:multidrug efflux pump subunit AcrB